MKYEIKLANKTTYENDTETESITEALEGITIEQVTTIREIKESSCTCTRCKGTGKLDEYLYYHDGNCFKCDGTGKMKKVSRRKLKNIEKYFDYSWMVEEN